MFDSSFSLLSISSDQQLIVLFEIDELDFLAVFWNHIKYCNQLNRIELWSFSRARDLKKISRIKLKSNLVPLWMVLCGLKSLCCLNQYVFATKIYRKNVVTLSVYTFTNNSVTVFSDVTDNIYWTISIGRSIIQISITWIK